MYLKVEVIEEERKNFLNISLDEILLAKLDAWLFRNVPFAKWNISSKEEFFEQFSPVEAKVAFDYAIKKLSSRSFHSSALIRTLEEKGFSSEAIASAIERIKHLGFLQDESYISLFVQKWMKLSKSKKEILIKARQYGLPLRDIEKELSKEEFIDLALVSLHQLIRKKYPILLNEKGDFLKKQKAYAALGRKGYSFSLITRAIKAER